MNDAPVVQTSLPEEVDVQIKLADITNQFNSESTTRKFEAPLWTDLQRRLIELITYGTLRSQVLRQFTEISEASVELFPTFVRRGCL